MRNMTLGMLIVFHSIVTIQAYAELNRDDLRAVTDAVTRMCLHPSEHGQYIKVEGEAGTNKIVQIAGLKIKGQIDATIWNGILQTIDNPRRDPAKCAEKILPLIMNHFVPLDKSTNVTYQYFHALSMMIVETPDGKRIGDDQERMNFYFGVLSDMFSHVNDVGIKNLVINELENRKFGTALLEGMCNQYRDEILQNASTAQSSGDERQTFNAVFDNARGICKANYWSQ